MQISHHWTRVDIAALFDRPFLDLIFEAQQVHRRYHAPNEVQLSTLLSIKTGGCPEDCGYCSQSAFADLGFEVVPGPLFQTPEESARMAIERDVDVVGASSLAAGHRTLVPDLIDRLRDMGRADIKVVVGGVIPAQDYDMLRDAGVQAIFGPGTNLVDAAGEVLKLLGHNLPPLDEAAE